MTPSYPLCPRCGRNPADQLSFDGPLCRTCLTVRTLKHDVRMLAVALLAGLVGGAVSHQLFTTTTGVSGYAQQEKG